MVVFGKEDSGRQVHMRDHAEAWQRVSSQKVCRINADTDVQSTWNVRPSEAKTNKKNISNIKVQMHVHVLVMVTNQWIRRWDGPREHQEAAIFGWPQAYSEHLLE